MKNHNGFYAVCFFALFPAWAFFQNVTDMTTGGAVREQLVSAFGLLVMLFIAWLFSESRWKLDLRLIVTGLAFQFAIALIMLKTSWGQVFFEAANIFITRLIACSNEGAIQVFGPDLVQKVPMAFSVLPTIVFVAALSAILLYLGVLQKIVQIMGWIMVRVMNVSGVEALAAAGNVYMSMTESPLLVRPYLATATRSELFVVMTAGMATIAGGVMSAYVAMGASAGHLLTTSVMSIPAAIVIAKIMVPEREISPTRGAVRIELPRESCNLMDAMCHGATDGLHLALNVAVMLISAIALVAMLNWFLTMIPEVGGAPLTLQRMLGWFFAPLAFVMGIPFEDVMKIGALLGEKTILNEFIAYKDLVELNGQGALAPRSFILAQYALCSFANIGSMAILVGGIGQLVPSRRDEFARMAFRSLVAGTLAGFCTACVAGMLL